MRLGQIRFENHITAAVIEGDRARPVPGYSLIDLVHKAEAEGMGLRDLASQLAMHHAEPCTFAIPIHPPEVWSATPGPAGCTILFKGVARVCVGPGQPVGIRFDSRLTTPGPALAVMLGRRGEPFGCTLANDLWARDVEQDARARTYRGACALGPVIVTLDELAGAAAIEIECTVERQGRTVFSGAVRVALPLSLAPIECLLRANPVPTGSLVVLSAPVEGVERAALSAGDTVIIRSPQIGELSSPAAVVE
jgi:2-dehydro-3-deoxy-D-arabinonate dehydratase